MTAPFYRRPPVRRSAIMWKFFRRAANLASRVASAPGAPTSCDRARPPGLSPPGRLQVERLEDRFAPGGLLSAGLDPSLEAAALFWQGPEGLTASQRTLYPGSDRAAPNVLSSTDLDSLGGAAPLPIPGGTGPGPLGGPFIHQNLAGPADVPPPFGNEPNQITDFNGFIGVTEIQGTGTGTDTTTGATSTLQFDADFRFMQGIYRGADGGLYYGTFAEV